MGKAVILQVLVQMILIVLTAGFDQDIHRCTGNVPFRLYLAGLETKDAVISGNHCENGLFSLLFAKICVNHLAFFEDYFAFVAGFNLETSAPLVQVSS